MIAVVNAKLKKAPSLQLLNVIALKYIFDKSHTTKNEEFLLNEGIRRWLKKDPLFEHEKKELNLIIGCLVQDKEGRFDSEKFAYKRAGVDYRKVYPDGI